MSVVKAKLVMPCRLSFNRSYHTDTLFLGRFHNSEPEPYQLGKITLSYKKGKKRKLIKGYIEADTISSSAYGLEWEYFFVPSSPIQAEKIGKNLGE